METQKLKAESILENWGIKNAKIEEVPSGHINRTWRVSAPGSLYALQWLNPIFAPELHLDIQAVTSRLAQQGLVTPRLLRTRWDKLWAGDEKTGVWRLFTWIKGETFLQAASAETCEEAGRLLGKFHSALWHFKHEFKFARLDVHNTQKHIFNLRKALEKHRDHAAFGRVSPVAQAILDDFSGLDLTICSPKRIVHGDPKLSNIIFAPDGKAICMVDLDTLARMPIALELGDALRSWCNPAGEEQEATFRTDFFLSALKGYAEVMAGLASKDDWQAIPRWTMVISLELAARFCTDALEESYFRWDEQRFESASEHNLLRARVQLALAHSIVQELEELEKINGDIWS